MEISPEINGELLSSKSGFPPPKLDCFEPCFLWGHPLDPEIDLEVEKFNEFTLITGILRIAKISCSL